MDERITLCSSLERAAARDEVKMELFDLGRQLGIAWDDGTGLRAVRLKIPEYIWQEIKGGS